MHDISPYVIGIVVLIGLFFLLRKAYKNAVRTNRNNKEEDGPKQFIGDYISKIIMLEEEIGARVGYKLLEPFWVPDTHLGDVNKLQGAAKEIADFVGLDWLTFVVSITKQRANVAGHVELSYSGNNVFIEISDSMRNFEDAVVATLAHEITHKYMQVNNISAGTGLAHEYENEVLTDITSVFLGLGKFMLNGSEEEKTHQAVKADGIYNVTETRRCGYLTRQQLAFVYRLVCAMRNISKQDMLSNLSSTASNAVLSCDYEYPDYFEQKLGTNNYRDEVVVATMKDVETLEGELSHANELLEFIQNACLKQIKVFLQRKRAKAVVLKSDLESLNRGDIYDPCLKYLISILVKDRALQIQNKAKQQRDDVVRTVKIIEKLKEKIKRQKFPITD
jgi:hypothetical protein